MSPRMQIVKDDNKFIIKADINDLTLSAEQAKEYFQNWLNAYPELLKGSSTYFFEDALGNKTEIKLH